MSMQMVEMCRHIYIQILHLHLQIIRPLNQGRAKKPLGCVKTPLISSGACSHIA